MKKTLLTIAAFAIMSGAAQAVSVWINPITGTNPNTANPYTTGQTVDPNLTVSGIGRGTGLLGTNANDRYNANNFGLTVTEAQSITGSKYFTFTLDANSGYLLNLTSLSFIAQGSATGPHSFAVFSSIGGFTVGNELLSFTQPGTSAYTTTTQTVDLSAVAFQNVAGPIEFRVYGWNASNGTTGTLSINNFDFQGMVAAVPEPREYGVAFGGLALALIVIRRRRQQFNA